MKYLLIISLVLVFALNLGFAQKYEPNWTSLKQNPTPQWLQNGKFGIYTHWGPYAVHAYGSNTTWYSFALYMDPNGEARKHFEGKFGKLTPDFGYKDLIPKFTAEKFDADEWADLFKKAGAKYAGPVAEHHDGFAMWDTKYSEWNAAKMGPKRDIVGELEKAIKARDMKYVTAFHHAANWFFFPVWDKQYDTGDPKNSGLYGQYHLQGEMRNQEFIDEWYNKIIEVIDNYSPDFIWFDFALDNIPEGYVKDFLAYYYNHADKKGKEVVVTYKDHDIIPGAGVRDLELGQEPNITYNDWITDSSVDDRGAWGYAEDLIFKSPNRLVDNLIDRVSKNGYLLLNVGPKPDGTIPEGAKEVLLEMGAWLNVNGEAIYNTTPWFIAAEGPTNLGSIQRQGFNESNVEYTPQDIRFTVNDNNLYATFLDWPEDKAIIKTIRAQGPGAENMEMEGLWAAAKEGHVEVIKQLIANGADINAKEPDNGSTPLIIAVAYGQNDAASVLIENGAKINAKNNDGSTALHSAAFLGHAAIVKLLLENGAKVNAKNKYGSTPLDGVTAEWTQELEGLYQFFEGIMQIQLDLEKIKAARPKVAEILRTQAKKTQTTDEDALIYLAGKTVTTELRGEEYTLAFGENNEVRISGGQAGDGINGYYGQDGQDVYIKVSGQEVEATYDGVKLVINENEGDETPNYPGFYKEEIKRITLLGDGKELEWKLTRQGLVINMPEKKPCNYAYVIKIERYHHPKLEK